MLSAPFASSRLRTIACFIGLLVPSALHAESIDFNQQIRPLLADKCLHCHGQDEHERKGGVRLDQRNGLFGETKNGHVLISGNPEASLLMQRVSSSDPDVVMPPPESKNSLEPHEIGLLKQWIQEGAPVDDHWAFVSPKKAALPISETTLQPIDAFIRDALKSQGLSPSPEADRRTLIRRATLDLTGLPPTPSEIDAFLSDHAPDAYERVVDRLLRSVRFGERMALAWMDAARYGDSSVFHADGTRDMWPWRDWVIDAYNANMPFDQFTIEQIAGDRLPNRTISQRVAAGFNRNHGTTDEGGAIDEEYRVEYVVDRVKTTSSVWMGLTFECAQCHDHKYDPISQKEYYQFFAYFNRTKDVGMQTRDGNAQPVVIILSDEQQAEIAALHQKREMLKSWRTLIPAREHQSDRLDFQIASTEAREKAIRSAAPTCMTMEDMEEPRPTYVLNRGHYAMPITDEEIFPGVPDCLPPMPEDAPADRLGLAQWLVDPDHPLTSRVAVNRYWQMFFGQGLVGTLEDFGIRGDFPSHPKLLDWLARDFIESGWDVKGLIRQMVTSATYRQRSEQTTEMRELDPENRLLSRAPRFRLQGEFVRDQALAVSGLLNGKVGGPSVKPYQPVGIWNEVALDSNLYYQRDTGEKLYRRGMYIYWKRSAPMPSMMAFDAPTREKCAVERQRTNTPMQALVTLNDEQFVEAARFLAQRLLHECGKDFEARLNHAFILTTGRPADELRQSVFRSFYETEHTRFAADPEAAEAFLAVGEAPRDPSLNVIEHATWTSIANAILNLDEVLTKE